MSSALGWLSDRDLVLATAWLVLSLFTFPVVMALVWTRMGLPIRPWSRILGVIVAVAVIWSCYSAADILGNITCERLTGEACLSRD